MLFKAKELTKTNIKFSIGSNVSFANSLRRILLGEIPSVAIDIVEIRENDTVLCDEMIAHRLGLVPIRCTQPIIPKKDCDCDSFCSRCSIRFVLKKSNETDSVICVTGQDLYTEVSGVLCHNTLIVKLVPGQKIDMTCIATLGTPQSHVKYCPVTVVGFNYDPMNKKRETRLWAEQDPRTEWPGINQPEEVDWEEVKEVEMDVEVVEGMERPKETLLKALEIYKEKMEAILESIQ